MILDTRPPPGRQRVPARVPLLNSILSLGQRAEQAIRHTRQSAPQLGFPGQSILAMSWGGFARALAAQAAWTIILAVIVALAARAGVAKTLREGA